MLLGSIKILLITLAKNHFILLHKFATSLIVIKLKQFQLLCVYFVACHKKQAIVPLERSQKELKRALK